MKFNYLLLALLSIWIVSCQKQQKPVASANLQPRWTVEKPNSSTIVMSLLYPYKDNGLTQKLLLLVEKARSDKQAKLFSISFSPEGLVTKNAAIVLHFEDAKGNIDSMATVAGFYEQVDPDNCVIYFYNGLLEEDSTENVFRQMLTHDNLVCSLPRKDGSVLQIKLPLSSFQKTYNALP